MIAYTRGRFGGPVGAHEVAIDTAGSTVIAQIYAPPGDLTSGDDVVAATATIPAGVVDLERTALLGPWPTHGAKRSDPHSLRSTPVVLLGDASLARIALAGVDRAGRA